MSEQPIPPRQRAMPENPAEISSISGVLSEDQKKVHVRVELTNGTTRPDLDLFLTDAEGIEICRSTIIENFGPRLDFTMHIRQAVVKNPLHLKCEMSYLDEMVHSMMETVVKTCSD